MGRADDEAERSRKSRQRKAAGYFGVIDGIGYFDSEDYYVALRDRYEVRGPGEEHVYERALAYLAFKFGADKYDARAHFPRPRQLR